MESTRAWAVFVILSLAPLPGAAVDLPVERPVGPSVDGVQNLAHPTHDPDLGQEAKIAIDGADPNEFFGEAVVIDNETLVAGAHRDENPYVGPGDSHGSVFVFQQTTTGWELNQKIVPPDHYVNETEEFGGTLALDGDTLLVGDSVQSADSWRSGAVYAFEHSNGTWTFQQKIPGERGGGVLSMALALEGDTAFVGVWDHLNGTGDTKVYTRQNGTWNETQVLEHGATSGDGSPLWVGDDVALIGDQDQDEVHAYERGPTGWVHASTIESPGGGKRDNPGFGWSVDGDADSAVVGQLWNWRVHVLHRSSTGWDLEAVLKAPEGASEWFGVPVAIEGDRILVGAGGESKRAWQVPDVMDKGGETGIGWASGSVYVYRAEAGGPVADGDEDWEYEGRLTTRDAGRRDWFGSSLDLDNGTMVAGAPGDAHGRNTTPLEFLGLETRTGSGAQGSAYTFSLDSDDDALADPAETWHGTEATNPDTDGDGFDEGTELTCGWDPLDPRSPTAAGEATSYAYGGPVPIGDYRWELCHLEGS